MTGIDITVTGATAALAGTQLLTAGMVGVPVRFALDAAWDGLIPTAVFRAGGTAIAIPEVELESQIPWEVLKKSGCTLYIGLYGSSPDGSRVIPTVWVEAGTIAPGTDPEATEGADPTLPVWRQAMDMAQSVRNDADAGVFDGKNYVLTNADRAEIAGIVADEILHPLEAIIDESGVLE